MQHRPLEEVRKQLRVARWHQRLERLQKWFLRQELRYYQHCEKHAGDVRYRLENPDGWEADGLVEMAVARLPKLRKKTEKVRKKQSDLSPKISLEIEGLYMVLTMISFQKTGKLHALAADLIQPYQELRGEE